MRPLDWSKVKPSTSPRLSRAEVEAVPRGMVVLRRPPDLAWSACRIEGTGLYRAFLGGGLREEWSCLLPLWVDGAPWPEIRLPRLPRLSFAMTVDAVRERRKTVTRRLSLPSWWREGAWFLGVDRIRQAGAQGLAICRCGLATREPLVAISQQDVYREGFDTSREGFCAMFRSSVPRDWDGWVWRLPFTCLEIPA